MLTSLDSLKNFESGYLRVVTDYGRDSAQFAESIKPAAFTATG
jgi:hypothetical protein